MAAVTDTAADDEVIRLLLTPEGRAPTTATSAPLLRYCAAASDPSCCPATTTAQTAHEIPAWDVASSWVRAPSCVRAPETE